MLLAGAGFVALGLLSLHLIQRSPSDAALGDFTHRVFPFVGNVIYNAGLGSVTLSDVYILDLPLRPRWPTLAFVFVEAVLLLANALWAPVLESSRLFLKEKKESLASEILAFAFFLAVGSFLAVVQAYRRLVFDRYFFPSFLALVLGLGVLLEARPPLARAAKALFAVTLGAIAFFAVSGLHDSFAWNEERWALYSGAIRSGVHPTNIEGGYEIDGWTLFDFYQSDDEVSGCRGPCSCDVGWYCQDNSYTIAMNPRPGYRVVASREPRYWLARGPKVLLLERLLGE